MHRFTSLCALAVGLTMTSARVAAQNTTASDSVDFVGFMAYSDAWTDGNKVDPQGGFYSFTDDPNTPFSPCSIYGRVEGTEVSTTFHDDEAFSVKVSGYWYKYSVGTSHVNAYTWKETSSTDLGTGYVEGIAEDITYSYADGKTYAVTYNKMGNSEFGYLCTVDEQTGQFTRIAQIPFMYTVAADATGQLWSIGADGALYRLDRVTGVASKVGKTGFIPKECQQSATFDLRTGKLYWAINGFAESDNTHLNIVCGIVSVDTATGKATVVRNFPRYERFSSLFVRDAHPSAPDRLTSLNVDAEDGEGTTGSASFTLPSLTYSQQTLTGNVSYVVTLDGEKIAEGSGEAGTPVTLPVDFATAGAHTVAVQCSANGHSNPWARLTVYAGTDTPAAPTNLKVEADDMQASVKVTWDAVTKGANDGYINPEEITYNVVRMPSNTLVGRALTTNSFVDTPKTPCQRIRYVVTATYKRKTSDRTFSEWVRAGKSWDMPFTEMFEAEEDFNKFTTVDANGDGGDYWEAPSWKYDNAYGAAFYYNKKAYAAADDWLITPPLAFDATKLYKVTFQTYGYYGYTNHLQLAVGAQPTAEAMGKALLDKEYVSTMNSVKTFSAYIVPGADTRYVGFHNISTEHDHMSIDNICVEEISSNLVPAAPELSRVNGKVGAVKLYFNAPALNARGDKMQGKVDVRIYCGTETKPAATFEVEPGAAVQWTDQWAAAMVNVYRIAAVNAEGEGIPIEVTYDLTETEAQAPEDVKAEALSDDAVRITWKRPAAATGAVQYALYRVYDFNRTLLANHLDGFEFVDTHASEPLPEGTPQGAVTYVVESVNSVGTGGSTTSADVRVGKAYPLPFSETWFQQSTATNPWGLEGTGNASWIVEGYGYDPSTPGQDGAGMVKFTVNYASGLTPAQASYISPSIDFTSLRNPVARFYIYCHPSLSDQLRVTVSARSDNGETIALPAATFAAKADEAGWKECVVSLDAAKALTRGHLVFTGEGTVAGQNLHLDNLTITGESYTTDARVTSLEVPATVVAGREHDVTVRVKNCGAKALRNVKVTLVVGNEELADETIDEIAVDESEELVMSYEPEQAGTVQLEARVTAEGDEQPLNDALTRTVVVDEATLAYINTLQGDLSEDRRDVTLTWNAPTATSTVQQTTDDFESYDDFAISDLGGWTLHDGDGVLPFTFKDATSNVIEWPNNTSLQAFIVFNPSKTVLSGAILPHSGEKSMVSFGSPYAQNNDWLISPRLSGHEQLISFYARGIDSQAAREYFRVLYSTTDTLTTSFHPVSGTKPLMGGTEWKEYVFNLPEGARYFAIQYMGIQQSGLMVDDVCFSGYYAASARPDAYVIYRNGKEIATVDKLSFTDSYAEALAADAVVSYQVQAVYGSLVSELSAPFTIAPAGIEGNVTADATAWTVTPQRGAIRIARLAGLTATVLTADGRIAATVKADATVTLPAGVYVVTAGTTSRKVVVM